MFGIDDLLIGAGVSLIGSYFEADAKKSANAQAQALQKQQLELQKQQLNMQKDMMQFNMDRYNKWYNVYGTLQEDLGTYFKNLKGSDLSTVEQQQIQKHMQIAKDKIKADAEARGINGSGYEGSMLANIDYQGELQKAMVDATADDRARQQQMQFLAMGRGQGNAISNAMVNQANAMNGTLNSMGNTANNLGNLANQAGNIDASFWSDLSYGAGNLLRHMNPTGGSALGYEAEKGGLI